MSSYTPGPWHAWFDPDGPSEVRDPSDKVVVNCSRLAHEADARLIAAAPELLELVAQAVHACEDDDEVWLGHAWVKAARAAVKRAEQG